MEFRLLPPWASGRTWNSDCLLPNNIPDYLENGHPVRARTWYILLLLERPNLFAVCNNTFSKWWER
jgi:hypothetical protein